MIPLSVPYLNGNEWKYLKNCLDSNWVSSAGSFVQDFENSVADYVKARYTVACVNGTTGLFIALKLCGIEPGDEVIVPTLTFIAPVNAVRYLRAEPVFMDCDDFMNLDVDKLRDFCARECTITRSGLKNKRSGRVIKGIIPVHIFGIPCNMSEIIQISKKYKLKVIEDATESLGSYCTEGMYRNRFTGTIGDFGVYSFNGNKIITTGGGGMIVIDNKIILKQAKYLINQAKDDPVKCIHNEVGFNFRLTNLAAALGLAQLEKLDVLIKARKRNHTFYNEGLRGIPGLKVMDIPKGTSPNYWLSSLVVEQEKYGMNREELLKRLAAKGIETRPIWYLNHWQKPYRNNQSYKIEKAIWFWRRVINLPSSSNLKENELQRIVSTIKRLGR